MDDLTPQWARGFSWVYLMLAVGFAALAVNWIAADAWAHGMVTLAAAAVCLWAHDRFRVRARGEAERAVGH